MMSLDIIERATLKRDRNAMAIADLNYNDWKW